MDLVVIEQLRQLKYRYLRSLDLKQWDEFGDTLTEDVDASYGAKLRFTGRDAVVDFMRQSLGPDRSSPCTSAITRRSRWTATRPPAVGTSTTR